MNLDEAVGEVNTKPAAYVLQPVGGTYLYKGSCRDLVKRMKDHLAGRVRHTKNKRPLKLVCFEYFEEYSQAKARESYFKTGTGRDFLKSVLEKNPG